MTEYYERTERVRRLGNEMQTLGNMQKAWNLLAVVVEIGQLLACGALTVLKVGQHGLKGSISETYFL